MFVAFVCAPSTRRHERCLSLGMDVDVLGEGARIYQVSVGRAFWRRYFVNGGAS